MCAYYIPAKIKNDNVGYRKYNHLYQNNKITKSQHLSPGYCISVYQYQTIKTDQLQNNYRKYKDIGIYNGVTTYVDNIKGVIFVYNQALLRAGEMIFRKTLSESFTQKKTHKWEKCTRCW